VNSSVASIPIARVFRCAADFESQRMASVWSSFTPDPSAYIQPRQNWACGSFFAASGRSSASAAL